MQKLRWVLVAVLGLALAAAAQVAPGLYSGMRWRLIGPFRAGRVSAVAGIPGDASTYYLGNPEGGVFKTTSGGTVWTPIFDHEPVSSIGAIAIAPSNPDIVYVGTGDVVNVGGAVNQGDGVYKSTDAGRTWQHLGLDDSRHISTIIVDPKNPDVVLVAALGHTYAPNAGRGVFRSTDGGRTWAKVLYKDETAGAIDMAADPGNPQEMFAALEPHAPDAPATDAAIYKSLDEGQHWTAVSGGGLPELRGRIGVAVAAHTQGQRVFALTTAGLYRSDDGGASWKRSTTDRRVMGAAYFGRVYVSPANPDVVYVMQTSMYRSTDGGHTFAAFKGAPGGDDYHEMWIDPTNAQRIILGVDQGETISLNGGKQWSLGWYNLPNGQFYHIAVDHQSPFKVYGTQQDSGSAAVSSFGRFGEITFMDWRPSVGAYEFGYIHPDLSDANFIFATGGGTALNRYNWKTEQVLDISPPAEINGMRLRYAGSPQAEQPQDPHHFYLGAQAVLETNDRGLHWQVISPDLTGGGRAAISALTPSAARVGEIWAGTSDGQVQVTMTGTSWRKVTPPGLPPGMAIEMIAPSPEDARTAYVVGEDHTHNDFAPYIYRTRDGGASWARVTAGIPTGAFVRVVRVDPKQAGLLYAGTEHGAFVSFNAGAHWQPLQLNLPQVSVRDLAVYNNDLVAGTYGRALWVLDDLTPLRAVARSSATDAVRLYPPEPALRRQPNIGYDTPFPPEMATGTNPPAGAIVNYYLPQAAQQVTLSVYDAQGALVRTLTSTPPPPEPEPMLQIPNYWLAQPHPLPTGAGMHRVTWDLRYPPPPAFRQVYPIAALLQDTPADPRGPFVTAGSYELRLAVDGKTYRQPLQVTMDPVVSTPAEGLQWQLELGLRVAAAMRASYAAAQQAAGFDISKLPAAERAQAEALRGAAGGGRRRGRGRRGGPAVAPSFRTLNGQLGNFIALIELSDDAPTPVMGGNFQRMCGELQTALDGWEKITGAAEPKLDCGPK